MLSKHDLDVKLPQASTCTSSATKKNRAGRMAYLVAHRGGGAIGRFPCEVAGAIPYPWMIRRAWSRHRSASYAWSSRRASSSRQFTTVPAAGRSRTFTPARQLSYAMLTLGVSATAARRRSGRLAKASPPPQSENRNMRIKQVDRSLSNPADQRRRYPGALGTVRHRRTGTTIADFNEAARVYRAYSAHRSNLMPPTSLI